jgi:hypothetical protein
LFLAGSYFSVTCESVALAFTVDFWRNLSVFVNAGPEVINVDVFSGFDKKIAEVDAGIKILIVETFHSVCYFKLVKS